jgi:hypothetical protein
MGTTCKQIDFSCYKRWQFLREENGDLQEREIQLSRAPLELETEAPDFIGRKGKCSNAPSLLAAGKITHNGCF